VAAAGAVVWLLLLLLLLLAWPLSNCCVSSMGAGYSVLLMTMIS
jgi:hypothetical protein